MGFLNLFRGRLAVVKAYVNSKAKSLVAAELVLELAAADDGKVCRSRCLALASALTLCLSVWRCCRTWLSCSDVTLQEHTSQKRIAPSVVRDAEPNSRTNSNIFKFVEANASIQWIKQRSFSPLYRYITYFWDPRVDIDRLLQSKSKSTCYMTTSLGAICGNMSKATSRLQRGVCPWSTARRGTQLGQQSTNTGAQLFSWRRDTTASKTCSMVPGSRRNGYSERLSKEVYIVVC